MLLKILLPALMVITLSGCQSVTSSLSSFGDSAASIDDLPDVSLYPSDDLTAMAKVQFRERNYGMSYALFKRAVEIYPDDTQAWLGYAASADQLGRFDNADYAYNHLARVIPNRPEYLNNVGYSYMLRGNLPQARRYFVRAYEIDPNNEITANNLELLRNSTSLIKQG